ncbi:MacS family sensor histidine kinase [Planosporangium sp. 12N6]|uniref:MacS family sensor histidine kinase n=1 Tax=Planosporangium spinosum TaxID=3402278 RepID=UPI003CF53050
MPDQPAHGGPRPRPADGGPPPRPPRGAPATTATPAPEPPETPMWRALAVFRLAALGYASLLVAYNGRHYAHPVLAWMVVGVMTAWSVATIYGYARPRWRTWPLLGADLLVTAACVIVSPGILGAGGLGQGFATLPAAWIAGPVLAWAVSGGRRRGAVAAVLLGLCDQMVRTRITPNSLDGDVLLLLAGIAVGHVSRLAVDAHGRLQRATELEAANRERERLARGIHDSVLQVLALVARRGAELGGDAAELGRLAGEQEVALRALIGATQPPPAGDGPVDLRSLLAPAASATVSVATPAHPVPLPPAAARELAAAVAAALTNVDRHGGPGARAWVLVEDDDEAVTVSVRDDGPGIPAGRLEQAEADGRLGVAQSIRGRVRDLGGTVTITSEPGEGTEVELRVPRGPIS